MMMKKMQVMVMNNMEINKENNITQANMKTVLMMTQNDSKYPMNLVHQ